MADGISSFSIGGNLTGDPTLYQSERGTAWGFIKVAVNRRRKQGEEWVDAPSFLDIKLFGKQAENAAKYLGKGDQVFIQGRIESGIPKGGQYHAPIFVAETLVFGIRKSGGVSGTQTPGETLAQYAEKHGEPMDDFRDIDFGGTGDDIPF
jgi:single-strand DNA-binding protein